MTKTMSRELTALCARLKRWRRHGGGRGKRVPPALWRQAARVAQADGVYKTACATRLNYDRLRSRLARIEAAETERPARSAPPRAQAPAPSSGQFVAVQMKPARPTPALTIELIRKSGECMRIESTSALDLTSVVQAFWRQS